MGFIEQFKRINELRRQYKSCLHVAQFTKSPIVHAHMVNHAQLIMNEHNMLAIWPMKKLKRGDK